MDDDRVLAERPLGLLGGHGGDDHAAVPLLPVHRGGHLQVGRQLQGVDGAEDLVEVAALRREEICVGLSLFEQHEKCGGKNFCAKLAAALYPVLISPTPPQSEGKNAFPQYCSQIC